MESKFAPKFDGDNFQYKYLQQIGRLLEDNGIDLGNGPADQQPNETYVDYNMRLMLNFIKIDKHKVEIPANIQRDFDAIVKDAPFYNSNCYGYSVDSSHVTIPNPGDSSSKLSIDTTTGDYKVSYPDYQTGTGKLSDAFKAAVEDGLIPAKLDENGYPIPLNGEGLEDSYYLVAFYANDDDYHWIMENSEGWSHQWGNKHFVEPLNIEYPHRDFPETHSGHKFVSYAYVPATRLDVGLDGNKNFMESIGLGATSDSIIIPNLEENSPEIGNPITKAPQSGLYAPAI